MITYADHPDLPEPHGYHHAARAEGPTIHVAGQTWGSPEASDPTGVDLVEQTSGAVGNAVLALEGAGGGAAGILTLDVFVVDLDETSVGDVYRGIGRAARAAGFGAVPITVLGVAALAVPGALVEVRATGVPLADGDGR